MLKKLTTIAAALTIVGCASVPKAPAPLDPQASCVTETARLVAEFPTSKSDLLMAYWKSQSEINQTWAAASMLNDELPDSWQSDFQDVTQNVFLNSFASACSEPGTTVAQASVTAASELATYLVVLVQKLEEAIDEYDVEQTNL